MSQTKIDIKADKITLKASSRTARTQRMSSPAESGVRASAPSEMTRNTAPSEIRRNRSPKASATDRRTVTV